MPENRIGRYEIVHEIARGGMAIVYLAKDTFMERLVAVKVLPRVFMHDPQFEKRFTREARVVASLEHPAIVPVYDFGYQGDQPFMVYRYMSGGTLKDKIQEEGAKSIGETYNFISRITPAIDKAHDSGIIHRDLKPSNILFDDDNKAYVADFGIAKIVESTSHLTGNAIVGTPAYMSPEQFTGDVEVGRYSDIYALGIILYELLSGELPFKADTTPRLMKLHIMDPVPSIREIRAELPQDVDAILGKTLAKAAEDRYQRVEQVRGAFLRVIQGLPTVHDAPAEEPGDDEEVTVVEPEIFFIGDEATIEPIDLVDEEIIVQREEDLSEVLPIEKGSALEDESPGIQLPKIPLPVVVINLKEILKHKEFLAVLLVGMGWMIGHLAGSYFMSTDPAILLGTLFIFVGVFGGIILAAASKWLLPTLHWWRVLIIAVGWFVSWGVLWALGETLGIPASWDLEYISLQVLVSLVGGLITGLSLFWEDGERIQRTISVMFGWGVATLIGIMFNALMNLEAWLADYYIIDEFISVDGLIAYSLIGAFGASITTLQIKKSAQATDAPLMFDFSDSLQYMLRKNWIALLLLLIAWPISEVILQIVLELMEGDTSLIYLINGGVGGLLTGFAIKRLKPSFGWRHIFLITIGWMLLWEGRWYLAGFLGFERGLSGGWFLVRLIAAAAAGAVTGAVLQNAFPKMNWIRVIPISVSWILGWGISTVIVSYFFAVGDWKIYWETPIGSFSYFWLLLSVLIGLIGGVSTVREILNVEGVDSPRGEIVLDS